jgi:hypothetical protein
MEKAIGIDPDATGFVCAVVDGQSERPATERFSVAAEGLEEFIRWTKAQGECIVALEGIHGQSRPIERALREAGVVFHSSSLRIRTSSVRPCWDRTRTTSGTRSRWLASRWL